MVDVFGSNGNKVLWEVVDDYVIEEQSFHDEIGLWGFKFNLLGEYKEGLGR